MKNVRLAYVSNVRCKHLLRLFLKVIHSPHYNCMNNEKKILYSRNNQIKFFEFSVPMNSHDRYVSWRNKKAGVIGFF